jgi:uncharacterized membrane protein
VSLALFLACTGSADSGACTELGWAGYGDVFLRDWCRSCHSAAAPNRFGAPEGMDFDTLDDVHTWIGPIEDTVIGDESMPLGGGIDDASRAEFGEWIGCGAPA